MSWYKAPNSDHAVSTWQHIWLAFLAVLLCLFVIWTAASAATPLIPDENRIVLPSSGQVTVNFISTGGPGDYTRCEGNFGLKSPREMMIYPEYLYNAGIPFPIPGALSQGTELVFYLDPHDPFCPSGPFFSTDPSRARITHPNPNTWIIGWEDWIDADFNDLVVQVDFLPGVVPFLDLPYDYSGSTFANESRDTEQRGKVNSYFDHEYPTYCNSPNTGGCSSKDTKAVNFHGYDGDPSHQDNPPYKVVYNGHDGIDFSLVGGTPVLAAASGTIITKTWDSCTGKTIAVQHDNGLVTEYFHLSGFAQGVEKGTRVTRLSIDDPNALIGYIGNTGSCSGGNHLHFLVRNASGAQVDPYGWAPLPDAAWFGKADPWQQYNTDHGEAEATSYYLWIHDLEAAAMLSSSATTIISSVSGNAVATFPAGSHNVALRVQMVEGLQSALVPERRTVYSFSLFGYAENDSPVTTLTGNIALEVHRPTSGLQALSVGSTTTPSLYLWDDQSSTWLELPTTWNPLTNSARATTSRIGTFALAVPELRSYLPLLNRSAP